MQVTNFQPKNRRADLIINRDITEEFTCANSVEKALSLDDYDLKFEIYDPTDGNVDTPILTKDCVRIDERSGSFKISNVVTPGE